MGQFDRTASMIPDANRYSQGRYSVIAPEQSLLIELVEAPTHISNVFAAGASSGMVGIALLRYARAAHGRENALSRRNPRISARG